MDRRPWIALLAVFALALSVRGAHLAALHASYEGTPLYSLARGDASYHWHEARAMLEGDPLLRAHEPWKSVGYTTFLAGAMALLGPEPGPLRTVTALLGALNVALLLLLARRSLPGRWAIAAAVAGALHPTVVLFDGELFLPTLLVFLNLLGLLALGRRGAVAGAAAGSAFGAAAVVHPVQGLVAVALLPWTWRRSRRDALALALGCAAAVSPFAVQNFAFRGTPVLLSASGGINLYVGNHPAFDQWSGQQISTATWNRLISTPLDSGIEGAAARDRFYLRLAVRRAVREPLGLLRVLGKKLSVAIAPVELGNNIRLDEVRERSWVLRALDPRHARGGWVNTFWIPLVLLGGAHLARRGGSGLALWSASILAATLVAFVTARYRVPLLFVGSIGAMAYLREVLSVREVRRRALLVVPVSALAIVGVLVARPQSALPPPEAWAEAQVEESAGRTDRALERLASELSRGPADLLLRAQYAQMLARAGRVEQAVAENERVLAAPDCDPDLRSEALEQIGLVRFGLGDLVGARRSFEAALEVGADDARWRGVDHYALGLDPTTACRLRLLLARVEVLDGRPERARRQVGLILEHCPDMESVTRPARLLLPGAP